MFAGARVTDSCLPDGTVPALYPRALIESSIPYSVPMGNEAYGPPQLILVNINTNDWNCGGFDAASAAAYKGLLVVRLHKTTPSIHTVSRVGHVKVGFAMV